MKWVQKQYPFLTLKEKSDCKNLFYVYTKKGNVLNFLNSLYENSTIYLERKYQRYLTIKLKIESDLARNSKLTQE